MNRPLWRLAWLYAGGLLVADQLGATVEFWLVVSLVLVGALPFTRSWRMPLLVASAFSLGAFNLASRSPGLSPAGLDALSREGPEIVVLHGTLLGSPSERIIEGDDEETRRTLALIRVTGLERNGRVEFADDRVAATMHGTLGPEFFAGQTVAITGVLKPPRAPMAPGLFDYGAHLERRGIRFVLETLDASDWAVVETGRRPPIADRFNRWARDAMQRGLSEEDVALRLNWGMAMGWRTALTDDVSEPFLRTGTMHIFAISGLHIAFIAALLLALMEFLRLPRAWAAALTIPLVWFYTVATGLQPSAVRASVMMTVLLFGKLLNRPSDGLNSLGAAALILLVADPQQLFQASFQLSFCVVLGILLLLPAITGRLDKFLSPDPLLPPELRPAWKRRLDAPLRWLALTFATSLAAWLASVPLSARYFHYFTPVSLIANLAVVPLASLALASNLAAILTAGWFTAAAEVFNHAAWLLMLVMTQLCEEFASLPGAWWHVREPALWETLLYYGVLIALLTGVLARRRRWLFALPMVGAVWALGVQLQSLPARHDTTITAIPLSGGDSLWIDAPGRANDLLIDVGNTNSHRALLEPFLRAQGFNTIPTLTLTHGDVAHVGAFDRLDATFRIGRVITSTASFRSAHHRKILSDLEDDPRPNSKVSAGHSVSGWAILHPARDDVFTRADDAALVLRREISGVPVLLLSDLGAGGVGAMLARETNLAADIVIAGMPAAEEPLPDALLARINPKVIVLTDSLKPAAGRASRKLRERLGRRGVPVFCTSDLGAVTLQIRNGRWTLTDASGAGLASGGGAD